MLKLIFSQTMDIQTTRDVFLYSFESVHPIQEGEDCLHSANHYPYTKSLINIYEVRGLSNNLAM